jgi:hypothetical protein
MPNSETSSQIRFWIIVILVDVLILGSRFGLDTYLTFAYAPLNYLTFMILVAVIPLAVIGVGSYFKWWWVRWPVVSLGILISIPAVFVILFTLMFLADVTSSGKDNSFEKIGELDGTASTFRVYRTNGGATTDFGLALRQERNVFPSVRLVSVLCSYYHASDAVIERLPNGQGRMTVAAYGSEYPEKTFYFKL